MNEYCSTSREAAQTVHFLHRAAWLIPVSAPPIPNGALLARGSTIMACGAYASLKTEIPPGTRVVDHGSCAIIPALVNAHTHLELTPLQGDIALPKESFSTWLQEMLPRRILLSPEAQRRGLGEGKEHLRASGTILCGDITNGACIDLGLEDKVLDRLVFLEVLGFNRLSLEAAFEGNGFEFFCTAASQNPSVSLAAHSCYSTSGDLIQQAKDWCRTMGRTFSIHAAEHPDEIEFLRDGTGYCRALLESLGRWAPCWSPPGMTPAAYLEKLGVLDSKTLLVHAVHMTDDDWEIVAKSRSSVCFCPRSNTNLQAGRPDPEKAIRLGIVSALGTDSLASNGDLSLFAEAVHVLENYQSVPPHAVLNMMTLGGAKALGRDQDFGTIEPGKRCAFLVVSLPEALTAIHLAETVIHQGNKGVWKWGSPPASD